MICLTVTRHSSSLRQRLFRLSEPSPQSRVSSLSIRSCTRQKHEAKNEWKQWFLSLRLSPLKVFFAHLHPLLSLVKPHEHVDDVKARRRLVLLVNPPEKCTESLGREAWGEHRHCLKSEYCEMFYINTKKYSSLKSFWRHSSDTKPNPWFWQAKIIWSQLQSHQHLSDASDVAVKCALQPFLWEPSRSSWALITCRALTTLIWCSSPRAWTQWWNRELMLSWIRWTSSPSTLSNFDSRYSRFTWNMVEGQMFKKVRGKFRLQRTGGEQA